MQHLLALWGEKVKCWLCDNQALVNASSRVLQEILHEDILVAQGGYLLDPWLDKCLPAYLLALFASTRSVVVQTWRFYELGLGIVRMCQYDDAAFYELFGITTGQIAYVFYLLGLAYDLPGDVLPLQGAEAKHAAPALRSPWDGPLVIDIGMGLGADTRYYLAQGFKVVAVEANPLSIQKALSIEWLKPFLHSGRLSFVHAAVASPGEAGATKTLFALPERPEQSNAQSWVGEVGGEPMAVRTIQCADVLRLYGPAVYMKIDIESNSLDCLESLHRAGTTDSRGFALPALLSLEVEARGLAEQFLRRLLALGYALYKMCRQYVYSPAPCEQGSYTGGVPGCGSGPFGVAAVDYMHGLEWRPLADLGNDTTWAWEFENGHDWFDLHVKMPD